jgi:hypothetical protein
MASKGSIHVNLLPLFASGAVVRCRHCGVKSWGRKAAHFMAVRMERKIERERERIGNKINPCSIYLYHLLSLNSPHFFNFHCLPLIPQIMNQLVD